MQYMASKQLYTFIAFIVIGVFYYFSQIKEGIRGPDKSKVSENKVSGVRTTSKNTSKSVILQKKASSFFIK